ncbi:MAG: hypothetical protein V3S69_03955 [Dehalococcoidales bacterium]
MNKAHSARGTLKIAKVIQSCVTHNQLALTYNWAIKIKAQFKPDDLFELHAYLINQREKLNISTGVIIDDCLEYVF